ncbi:helix-turn-helix transcriptional regulator [Vibrio sp. RE86]|uniref:helix-turn-helix transcriptional regulator n=1 Tax=Vibrio sp. RE86 TaxID=2607605 RepID=UPI0014935245|nr:helix-turn-helix transcriptional regulator [Vibrio sp. RE86]
MEGQANVLQMKVEFEDFELFQSFSKDWTTDFRQLKPGVNISTLQQVFTQNVIFAKCHFSNLITQQGESPKGYRSFAMLDETSTPISWRYLPVEQHQLMVFPKDGDFSCVSQKDFTVFPFSIHESFLESLSHSIFDRGWEEIMDDEGHVMQLPNKYAKKIQQVLCTMSQVGEWFREDPVQLSVVWHRLDLDNQLGRALLEGISHKDIFKLSPKVNNRSLLIKRSLDLLNSVRLDDITASQMAELVGTSQSTLERTFKDHFTMAPKAYVKAMRLHEVRKDLIQHNNKFYKVTDVANKYGFWHMGQFASDYRKLFGRLPSEDRLL